MYSFVVQPLRDWYHADEVDAHMDKLRGRAIMKDKILSAFWLALAGPTPPNDDELIIMNDIKAAVDNYEIADLPTYSAG